MMKVESTSVSSAAAEGNPRHAPIYALITDMLRRAIQDGAIEGGTVLLEGHIAEILGSTRTPVRQALRELESEGLVSRFGGRGLLAGGSGIEPRRVTLSPAMLGIKSSDEPVRKTLGWESIYDEVERDVVHLSVFGQYRINEVELARHFGVGRMVARDVLLRLESLGLMEKDERSRWVVTPLDANRINHLYELRWLLEPAALRAAMAAAPTSATTVLMEDLRKAMRAYPVITRTALDKLEHDLHVGYLTQCPNKELLQSLQRTRCLLTLSKHVLGVSAPMPKRDPFLAEHLAVLKAVSDHDSQKAQDLLRAHLEASCIKVSQRAAHVRDNFPTPNLSYIA
jgi:DNA-binding GntR family transcriptional regulator